MPPFFRRSKSVLTTAAELSAAESNQQQNGSTTTPVVIRKSKSFKRIRGLLRGESRRERRARKDAERLASTATPSSAATTTPTTTNRTPAMVNAADTSFISTETGNLQDMDDISTINYNVDVDDRSVITHSTVTGNNLFGAGITSEEQKIGRDNTVYTGVASPASTYILKVVLLLMDPETRRFELLQLEFDSLKALVSDVLAQIPISVTEDALRKQTYTGIAGNNGVEMSPTKLLATFCKGNEVLVAIPDGLPSSECIRLARPILSDENVVAMLQSSGIDASAWKYDATKMKSKKKSAIKSIHNNNNSSDPNHDIIGTDTTTNIQLLAEPLDAKIALQSKGTNYLYTIFIMIFIGLILQVFHIYISAPINLGSTISPGIWLSKCGLLSLFPSCTDNAYVHFHRNGTVSYYNSEKVLTWSMDGAVCPEELETVEDGSKPPSACIRGMHVQTDGRITIGGKPISHVTYYNSKNAIVPLSPWPFVESPRVKIWKK